MGFTLGDFYDYSIHEFDSDTAGDALARSIALTAKAVGDDFVAALFAASKCRVEHVHDDDGVWYTVRVATPPAPFAIYLREGESAVDARVRQYGGALLEDVRRIVIAPVIDSEPGWGWKLFEEHLRNRPSGASATTDAETLSRLLGLPGDAST